MIDVKNIKGWPVVVERDYGIRPAGRQDECFYCRSRIGEHHKYDCVCVEKKVRISVKFVVEDPAPDGIGGGDTVINGVWTTMEPYSWDASNTNFHKNESSWCQSNITNYLDEISWDRPSAEVEELISKLEEDDACMCGKFKFEFLDVVSEEPFIHPPWKSE